MVPFDPRPSKINQRPDPASRAALSSIRPANRSTYVHLSVSWVHRYIPLYTESLEHCVDSLPLMPCHPTRIRRTHLAPPNPLPFLILEGYGITNGPVDLHRKPQHPVRAPRSISLNSSLSQSDQSGVLPRVTSLTSSQSRKRSIRRVGRWASIRRRRRRR